MINALDEVGSLMFRLACLIFASILELYIPLGKNSIQRTEIKMTAKGYNQIALGKIKLPDAVKPMLRKMAILVIVSYLINPITTLCKALFLR